MNSHSSRRTDEEQRRQHANQASQEQKHAPVRRRRIYIASWTAGLLVIGAAVTIGLVTSQPTQTADTRQAPDFTLTTTAGQQVSLADYRGHNVLLFFSEGAGCESCLVQMAEIEKQKTTFTDADITVLPIVMNTLEQITADMQANNVTTPFLLDDGTVSTAYDTIGKGMHGGLPGHSFVLIDKAGVQRWYGEYPSMWLSPAELLAQVQDRLSG